MDREEVRVAGDPIAWERFNRVGGYMYSRLFATLGVIALFLNVGVSGEPKSNDAKNIQGTWEIVSFEVPGKRPLSEEERRKTRMKITADSFILVIDGRERPFEKYRLESSKTPKHIDFFVEEMKTKDGKENVSKRIKPGIYELKADELKVCFTDTVLTHKDNPKSPDPTRTDHRPKDFNAKEIVFVLKRAKN